MLEINNYSYNKETILEIGKFAVMWNFFEYDKFNKECEVSKIKDYVAKLNITEELVAKCYDLRDKLRDYLMWHEIVDVKTIWKKFYTKKKKVKNNDGSWQLIKPINDYVFEYLNNIPLKNIQLLEGCLYVCLRLRNNLFHGVKLYYSLDDQIEIFKALNNLLEEILKN